eukprot:6198257-Pleurochrysis_carterae.AAC.1
MSQATCDSPRRSCGALLGRPSGGWAPAAKGFEATPAPEPIDGQRLNASAWKRCRAMSIFRMMGSGTALFYECPWFLWQVLVMMFHSVPDQASVIEHQCIKTQGNLAARKPSAVPRPLLVLLEFIC